MAAPRDEGTLRKFVVPTLAVALVASRAPCAEKPTKADFIAACEDVLAKSTRRTVSTDNFEVVSDSSDPTSVSILASNLETLFHAMAEVFPAPAGRAPSGKVQVYLFHAEVQYKRLMTFVRGGDHHVSTVGSYFPWFDVLIFHMEATDRAELQDTMFHEGTHAYVDRMLCVEGIRMPHWLNEGLAEYVGHSRIEQGRIRPGSYDETVAGGGRSLASYGVTAAQVAARDRKDSLSFDYLLAFDPTRRVRSSTDESYALGWLLVDFLRHGRPGWAHGPLPAFLLKVGAGVPTRKALEDAYGIPAPELEAEFRKYVDAFQLPTTRPE